MKKNTLGKTGIEVTELCFGALPMGPLQKNMEVEKCATVVEHALRSGINFIDTAEVYRTYEPIKIAMDRTGIRPVISSKSQKKDYEGMEKAVNDALEALGLDYIDIFHLHAPKDGDVTFKVFEGAIECLNDMKAKGKIKAIGVATHSIAAVNQAAELDYIDIVFPLTNKIGRGIIDGTRDEMASAISRAAETGKGIYLMKALAGGNLIDDFDEAMKYARGIRGVSAIAVGMVSAEEVEYNIRYFNGEKLSSIPETVKALKNVTVIKKVCKGCETCIQACPNEAISMTDENKALINIEKCLTCGYCTPVCPEFAIRVI